MHQHIRSSFIQKLFQQVNTLGVLSFGDSFFDFNPRPFPLTRNDVLIAPFWEDINVQGGQVLYRLSDNETLLSRVGSTINDALGGDFSPLILFIASWINIPTFVPNLVSWLY